MTARARRSLACAAAAAGILVASNAHAALCSSLPSPVYVTGGGRVVFEKLGPVLAQNGITLVYKLQGSCLARDAILNGVPVTGKGAAGGQYWTSASTSSCDFDDAGNVAAIGVSDVFPQTCGVLPNGLPSNVGDFNGPVESYVFVVPNGSKQQVISRKAAYFAYGFGKDSGVDPWTNESFIFQRGPTSGTQQMMGLAIGVPPDRWKGALAASSSDVVKQLSAAQNQEAALGILTAEVYTDNLLQVKALAYQDDDQLCGYYTDTTAAASDKRNVRDGHYTIWGPLHYLTRLDANGFPSNATAKEIVSYITGTKDPPGGLDLIKVLAKVGLVPQCAMTVRRGSEMGPLSSFQPERGCGCYFDFLATGATTCQSCKGANDCPSQRPHCNYGYCEAQ